jgi:hypothetical protein
MSDNKFNQDDEDLSIEEINKRIDNQLMRVVYKSRSLVDGDGEKSILETAQRNNPLLDVTGVLVSNSGWFLQVLEGPGANVRKLLKVIESDPRHSDFYVFSTGAVDQRFFSEWSMVSVNLDISKFTQLVKDCMSGSNQTLEEVRNFLSNGKWTQVLSKAELKRRAQANEGADL